MRATGSKLARIYFAVAYGLGVVIIVNVAVAFVINAYLESWEKDWNRQQKRKTKQGPQNMWMAAARDDSSAGYDSGLDSSTEEEMSLGSEGRHWSDNTSSHLFPCSVNVFDEAED